MTWVPLWSMFSSERWVYRGRTVVYCIRVGWNNQPQSSDRYLNFIRTIQTSSGLWGKPENLMRTDALVRLPYFLFHCESEVSTGTSTGRWRLAARGPGWHLPFKSKSVIAFIHWGFQPFSFLVSNPPSSGLLASSRFQQWALPHLNTLSLFWISQALNAHSKYTCSIFFFCLFV